MTPNRVVAYTSVKAGSREKLHEWVMEKVADGWTPLGGIAFERRGSGTVTGDCAYLQTMVRYEPAS